MSKKANRSSAGKSRKSSSSSQNVGKGSSGYDYGERIRKCCISWHECVQKWESTNSSGLELATKIVNEQLQKSMVGKCSYISCSYMFLYYIRKFFWGAKMFLYFLILFSLIIPL